MKWTEFYEGPVETTREKELREAFEEAEKIYNRGGYDDTELVPVKARVARNLRSIYELQIEGGDLATIDDATHLAGIDMNEFIVQVALQEALALNRVKKSVPAATKHDLIAAREALDRVIASLDDGESQPKAGAAAAPRRRKRAS